MTVLKTSIFHEKRTEVVINKGNIRHGVCVIDSECSLGTCVPVVVTAHPWKLSPER